MKKVCLFLIVSTALAPNLLHATINASSDNTKSLPEADGTLSISGISKPASICISKNAGKIAFTIQGGSGSYAVKLSKEDGTPISSQSDIATSSGLFKNLVNGTYILKVTDSKQNTASSTPIVLNNICSPHFYICCYRVTK